MTETDAMRCLKLETKSLDSQESGSARQALERVLPTTRRDWLLQAGAGFGALALLDLLRATPGPALSQGLNRQVPVHGTGLSRPGA